MALPPALGEEGAAVKGWGGAQGKGPIDTAPPIGCEGAHGPTAVARCHYPADNVAPDHRALLSGHCTSL